MLHRYNLFSFHHRVIYRISFFVHKIISTIRSPTELRGCLQQTTLANKWYNLRSNNTLVITSDRTFTSYGDQTFKAIFSKFLNKVGFENFNMPTNDFKNKLLKENLNIFLESFLFLFEKFHCNLDFFFSYMKQN
jgi:hypothetical protein